MCVCVNVNLNRPFPACLRNAIFYREKHRLYKYTWTYMDTCFMYLMGVLRCQATPKGGTVV